MGNFFTNLKSGLTNKNTVTFLGVIACIAVLFVFYNRRVKEATTPTRIPYAKKAIGANEDITEDMIGYVDINEKFLRNSKNGVIRTSKQLIGRCVAPGTSIPEGGIFFENQVIDKSEKPGSIFDDIPDGQTIFYLSVNSETTYGNSIYPGNKIDLYMKATDETGKIIFGKFIESITVLGVRDSSNNDIFFSSNPGTPALLLFAVPSDMYTLLMDTKYISGVSLVPVPRNSNYTEKEGETKTTEYLKNYILSKAAVVPGS